MNSAILVIMASALGQMNDEADQIHTDFRKEPVKEMVLGRIGRWDSIARRDAKGFRIVLPEGKKTPNTVGVRSKLYLHGDFEITLSYELIESAPKGGYGAGVMLWLMLNDAPDSSFAAIARRSHPKKGEVYATDFGNSPKKNGKLAHHVKFFPAEVKEGQLRLVREGNKLKYMVSESNSNNFRLIRVEDNFGGSAVRHTKFAADSGGSQNKLDVILRELKIRAAELSPSLTATRNSTWYAWLGWIIACVLGIGILVGGGIICWRRLRQRPSSDDRRSRNKQTEVN